MIINLSNHPYSTWERPQKEAAKVYGDVVDLPFPKVAAEGDLDYIKDLKDKYVEKIVKLSCSNPCVIHIMGEMTLTFSIVNTLKSMGYTCIASTSTRIVDTLENGEKRVWFQFCRFRSY